MAIKRKFKRGAFEAIHSSASALHRVDVDGKRNALPYGLLKGKLKIRAGFDDPLPDDFVAALEGR